MTLARLPKIGRCCQLIIKNATGLTKYQMLIKAPGDLKMRLIRFIAATGLISHSICRDWVEPKIENIPRNDGIFML